MECHQFLLLLQDGVPLQEGAEEYVLSSQQESQGDLLECHQFLLLLQDGVPLQEEYVLSSQQESQGDHGAVINFFFYFKMGSRFRKVLKSMCCPASRKAKETALERHQFLLLLQDGVPLQAGAEEYVLSSQQESQGDHGVSSISSSTSRWGPASGPC